ncbi:hypothetical protein NLJ89_g7074 [Agrocybe chaxingu]|uniref:F-box domain-containing protein n=1 Tax=Agrocybe chaxingu TaxID=84603 RepID=A0A9W8MVE3_9AGAR|nr:hypothetical protein NLJ89_g7074 [Agrocybe chaxingu]
MSRTRCYEGWQEEIRLMDEEREALATRLTQLTHKRNATLPISSISIPEILSQIFVHLLHAEWDEYEPPCSIRWVSQVCQRWRHVALDNASLWTHWDLTECMRHQHWHAELARRAVSRLLTVRAEFHVPVVGCYDSGVQAMMEDWAPRIVSFEMVVSEPENPDDYTLKCLPDIIKNTPMLSLETLIITHEDPEDDLKSQDRARFTWFNQIAPKLRHFTLHGLSMFRPLQDTMFSALTSLDIVVNWEHYVVFRENHLLRFALSRMPALEALKLCILLTDSRHDSEPSTWHRTYANTVELPKLRHLHLMGHWHDTVVHFLTWLVIPSECSMFVGSLYVHPDDCLDELAQLLAQHIPETDDGARGIEPWRFVFTQHICYTSYNAVQGRDGMRMYHPALGRSFCLSVEMECPKEAGQARQALSPAQCLSLVSSWKKRNAAPSLCLCFDKAFHSDCLTAESEFVGTLLGNSQARRLSLTNDTTVQAVAGHLSKQGPDGAPLHLPSLAYIHLYHVDFSNRNTARSLRHLFDSRSNMGAPILRLALFECSLWDSVEWLVTPLLAEYLRRCTSFLPDSEEEESDDGEEGIDDV